MLANLDNGKVIHLVIRPHDAPSNPMNGIDRQIEKKKRNLSLIDNPTARPTRTMSGRLPMMEGYAFITLDSTEMSDNHSVGFSFFFFWGVVRWLNMYFSCYLLF